MINKNNSKTTEKSRKSDVIGQIGKSVKAILESFDTDDELFDADEEQFSECDGFNESVKADKGRRLNESEVLDEMAAAKVHRTIAPNVINAVRDKISRHNYDKNWATSVNPLPRYNDEQLLDQYVAALIIFDAECPNTEEDIESIGIFKNYALKLLDGSGTLQDIITKYNEQGKMTSRNRVGTTRAAAGFRKDSGKENFSFDNADNAPAAPTPEPEPAPEPVNEPEPEVNEPETDDMPDPESPDYPDYDEVDTDDIEDTTDTDYENDVDDIDDLSDFDYDNETGSDDEEETPAANTDEKIDLATLTEQDFYDPALNQKAFNTNDDAFEPGPDGQIGLTITIYADDDEEDKKEVKVFADTLGKCYEVFTIVGQASIANMSDKFFIVELHPVAHKVWKKYRNLLKDPDINARLETEIDTAYFSCFSSASKPDDIVKYIEDDLLPKIIKE